ncbi:O-antigen ligase family protein [Blastococcus sp. DSM 46786]|uniref:O-antigen ligase family protein n=1 Tax=Blastococcus sp. DSM 46786 TaxID=1798227 RepID=UPI00147F3AD6|nr:O-antigen ligase family protein [Blastococcus sp. DSM 46786]
MTIQMIAMVGFAPLAASWIHRHRPSHIRIAAVWFTTAQTASSLAGVLQAAGLEVLGESSLYGRSPGLAGHPNTMGVMASVAILITIEGYRRQHAQRSPLRGILVATFIVNATGLLVTGSTSSMISFVAALLVYAYLRRTSALVYVVGSVTALLTLALGVTIASSSGAFASPVDRLAQVTGQTDEISTIEDRIRTVAYAWNGIVDNPLFGAGMDDASGGTFDGVVLTHNLPIRAWYQGGLFAFIAIATVYGIMIGAIIKASRRRPTDSALPVAVAAILAAFALTSAMLQQPLYWAIFSTSIAVALHSNAETSKPSVIKAVQSRVACS